MLSVAEARARILVLLNPMGTEHIGLDQGLGRALAEPLHARRTQPPFSASAMDGYAVRRADAVPGASLQVIGAAPAGKAFAGRVGPSQAVRIFTGAPVPEGADDILIQEDTTRTGNRLTVHADRDTTPYIRPIGQDFREGDPFPGKGPLDPTDIALLAAMNHATLPVRRKPVVALIPTGDELVLPGDTPGPDQIVSSNTYGLAALLCQAGAKVRLLPIARDTVDSLAAVLDLAGGADLIVTLGGASVGDHDLVQKTALGQGLSLAFYKVAMRPGKPLMAGTLGDVPMIGLPGNPVSAMVCGVIFVVPAVRALLGLPPAPQPDTAVLAHDLGANGPREHYMRARIERSGKVAVFERQDSALLGVLQAANALVIRAPHAAAAPAGETVSILKL